MEENNYENKHEHRADDCFMCKHPAMKHICIGILTFLGAFAAFYVVTDWHYKRMLDPMFQMRKMDRAIMKEARMAERIARKDAIKADLITTADIPQNVREEIGTSNGEIINTLTLDLINHSKDKDFIGFSDDKFALLSQLRTFNYERIYHNEQMRQRKETIDKCIRDLFDYFRTIFHRYGFDYSAYEREGKQTARSFANYLKSMNKVYQEDPSQVDTAIADYIAGMTDSFALGVMEDVILPNSIKFFS